VERASTIKLAAALFAYWRWSLAEIHGAIGPLSSTPPVDELEAPF
jgi:hypothetical protein